MATAGPSRAATVTDEANEIVSSAGPSRGASAGGSASPVKSGGPDGPGSAADGGNGEGEGGVKGENGEGEAGENGVNGKEEEEGDEDELDADGLPRDASETLYLHNLNEKVRIDVMKETLLTLFKPYHPLAPIVAHRNARMRGQAFVSFADKKTADRARRDVNEFPLYGRPIIISFARTRSDVVIGKHDGDDALEAWKVERTADKKIKRRTNPYRLKQRAKAKAGATDEPAVKKPRLQMPDEYLPPNNVLFIQNLPEGTTQDDLRDVFEAHAGLLEIRTIPAKRDIAFVEFADEATATVAKDALHNFKIDGETKMKVTYARK